jgi:hypothetical protein
MFVHGLSLVEILLRELKEYHKKDCELNGADHDEEWRDYNIKLIKESLGEE